MGASFRNIGEIIELAGCDRLTIGPSLLEELANTTTAITAKLVATTDVTAPGPQLRETQFRWEFNEDAMTVEKLSEGIRNFAIDQGKLEIMLQAKLTA